MAYRIVAANVGNLGAGDELHAENPVKRNLLDRLLYIRQLYGDYPNALALQETGKHTSAIGPISDFEKPLATNQGTNRTGARGVATYATTRGSYIFEAPDGISEVVTTIHQYRDYEPKKGHSERRFALMNCYRNQSREAPDSVEHLREFIKSQTIRLRNTGIRDIIALGDFNSESFSLGGDYKEISTEYVRPAHRDRR